jgi:hypothetical protein
MHESGSFIVRKSSFWGFKEARAGPMCDGARDGRCCWVGPTTWYRPTIAPTRRAANFTPAQPGYEFYRDHNTVFSGILARFERADDRGRRTLRAA